MRHEFQLFLLLHVLPPLPACRACSYDFKALHSASIDINMRNTFSESRNPLLSVNVYCVN